MAKKDSVLSEFKEVDRIPPKGRTSWAYKVLDEFLGDDRKILCAEFEDDRKATAKQVALSKQIKAEGSQFAGKVNVERRGNKVYIEKM